MSTITIVRFLGIVCHYLTVTKGFEETGPTYRITRDFIFQSTPHRGLIYNPEHFEIVKQVNLQPLTQATDVLHKLEKDMIILVREWMKIDITPVGRETSSGFRQMELRLWKV